MKRSVPSLESYERSVATGRGFVAGIRRFAVEKGLSEARVTDMVASGLMAEIETLRLEMAAAIAKLEAR